LVILVLPKDVCKVTFCGVVELFAKAHILRVVGLFDVFREQSLRFSLLSLPVVCSAIISWWLISHPELLDI